jgi:hypothetical protein
MWIEPGACRLADVVPAMVDMTTDSPDHHVHVDHTPLSISQWSSIVDSALFVQCKNSAFWSFGPNGASIQKKSK